jgi:hypothetical protein
MAAPSLGQRWRRIGQYRFVMAALLVSIRSDWRLSELVELDWSSFELGSHPASKSSPNH